MSGSNPLRSYSLSVAQSDIPSTWMPDSRPRLANVASRRIVQIASQSGTVNAGQPILVALPYGMGAGFLCSGSAYIKFTITVTQAVGLSWAFKQSGSGSSVFQRVSAILSGQQAEVIHNYGALYNSLLLHATNRNYLDSDAKVHDIVFPGDFIGVGSYTVSIPIGLGCLNSRQHVPLFLLNGAQLQFDTNAVADALTQGTGDAISNYAISDFTVCFEQLVCEPQYEQSVKAMLAQGRIYQMPIDTWFNTRTASATSITQNVGLNSSSVRCVLWGTQPVKTARNAGHLTSGGQTSCFVYADGQLVHNSNLSEPSQQYTEMNRCLNVMFDTGRTSSAPSVATAVNAVAGDLQLVSLSRTLYASGAYLGGLSLQRETLDNGSFSFVGTPVSQLVFQWAGTTNTGEMLIFVALQQVLTIDAVGTCNIIR
jgi:hypothetical protein